MNQTKNVPIEPTPVGFTSEAQIQHMAQGYSAMMQPEGRGEYSVCLYRYAAPSGPVTGAREELREPDYYAVWSKTGVHIGLWANRALATKALEEYLDGSIVPLYAATPTPVAEPDPAADAARVFNCVIPIADIINTVLAERGVDRQRASYLSTACADEIDRHFIVAGSMIVNVYGEGVQISWKEGLTDPTHGDHDALSPAGAPHSTVPLLRAVSRADLSQLPADLQTQVDQLTAELDYLTKKLDEANATVISSDTALRTLRKKLIAEIIDLKARLETAAEDERDRLYQIARKEADASHHPAAARGAYSWLWSTFAAMTPERRSALRASNQEGGA